MKTLKQFTDLRRGAEALNTGEGIYDERRLLGDTGQVVSGVTYINYFTCQSLTLLNQITTFTGATAQTSATFCSVMLYSVDVNGQLTWQNLVVNDTTLWTAPYTAYTRGLVDPNNQSAGQYQHAMVRGSRYALALTCTTAGTPPSFVGIPCSTQPFINSFHAKAPRLHGQLTGWSSSWPFQVPEANVNNAQPSRLIYAELS